MIEMFSLAIADLCRYVSSLQARVRCMVFVEQRGFPQSHLGGLEFGAFDKPSVMCASTGMRRAVRGPSDRSRTRSRT